MDLTDKEKISLQLFEGKKGKFRYYLTISAPLYLAAMAMLSFYLANKIGAYEGINSITLFKDWIAEIDINKTYKFSGVYLKAKERFDTALFLLAGAIMLGAFVYRQIKEIRRDRKIVAILKKQKKW